LKEYGGERAEGENRDNAARASQADFGHDRIGVSGGGGFVRGARRSLDWPSNH
jgi:hypothetical protein